MKYRGPSFYPPEGHDWVETEPLRHIAEHNAALEEEMYMHRVATFRSRFISLMEKHSSLDDTAGWLLFCEAGEASVLTGGTRDTLLTVGAHQDSAGNTMPQLRIITNENCPSSETDSTLTEDVTVRPSGHAQYFIGAVTVERTGESNLETLLKDSFSPLIIMFDGRLSVTTNVKPFTPVVNVHTNPNSRLKPAQPFGDDVCMMDRLYALDRAQELLDEVVDMTPALSHEP